MFYWISAVEPFIYGSLFLRGSYAVFCLEVGHIIQARTFYLQRHFESCRFEARNLIIHRLGVVAGLFVMEIVLCSVPALQSMSCITVNVYLNRCFVLMCFRDPRKWAFDQARTHNLHITSQTCNPLRHSAPY